MEASADNIRHIRNATGLGVMEAKAFIQLNSEDLCQRILRAKRRHGVLHDPIEEDPKFGEAVREATEKATHLAAKEVEDREKELDGAVFSRRGQCHRVWVLTKMILKDRGIVWFSPADLNPGIVFD
jgi:hypothetical protein